MGLHFKFSGIMLSLLQIFICDKYYIDRFKIITIVTYQKLKRKAQVLEEE